MSATLEIVALSGTSTTTVSVPISASLEVEQTYEEIGGVSLMRTLNGTAIKQAHWRKLRTTIAGQGWTPDGLTGIDWDNSLTVRCIAPRSIVSTSNTIVIPSARRTASGYEPFGFAHKSDGSHVTTAVSMATNTATLTAVTSAASYTVCWYPEFSAYAEPPRQRFDVSGAAAGWELTAEQI